MAITTRQLKDLGFEHCASVVVTEGGQLGLNVSWESQNGYRDTETHGVYLYLTPAERDEVFNVMYVGKAKAGPFRRLNQHQGGWNDPKRKDHRLRLHQYRNPITNRYDVYFRPSAKIQIPEFVEVLHADAVSAYSLEEETLIRAFKPPLNAAADAVQSDSSQVSGESETARPFPKKIHLFSPKGLPSWLARIDQKTIKEPLPLGDVLQNSFYYPAADFDGDPIAYLAGDFFSFVYVDYGRSRAELMGELSTNSFLGYDVLAQRAVSMEELVPNGWMPKPPPEWRHDRTLFKDVMNNPFCEWLVFQRSKQMPEEHGPQRFSLLYLCADGVAAYQAMYTSNGLSAGGIGIIQPGHGFGLNWADFTDPNGPMAREVLGNPAGRPSILLYGGAGGREHYAEPCWPEYGVRRGVLGNTSIHVWELEEE